MSRWTWSPFPASTLAATPGSQRWIFLQSTSEQPGTRRRGCWAASSTSISPPDFPPRAMSTPEAVTPVVREAQSAENYDPRAKQKAAAKLSRIPVKVVQAEVLKKPEWIRVKAGSPTTRFYEIKQILRESNLHTVCEEASCPHIGA